MNMESVVELKPNRDIPALTSGDTVKVSIKVVEGDKERTQIFQGVIIKVRNRGAGSSFTVRRVTYGVGVERTFPIYSPRVEKVEIIRRGKKRRAKLYYLRGLSAKTSRLKERRLTAQEMEQEREEVLRRKQELEREREEVKARQLAQEQGAETETEEASEPEAEQAPTSESEPETEQEPKLEQEPAGESEPEEPEKQD